MFCGSACRSSCSDETSSKQRCSPHQSPNHKLSTLWPNSKGVISHSYRSGAIPAWQLWKRRVQPLTRTAGRNLTLSRLYYYITKYCRSQINPPKPVFHCQMMQHTEQLHLAILLLRADSDSASTWARRAPLWGLTPRSWGLVLQMLSLLSPMWRKCLSLAPHLRPVCLRRPYQELQPSRRQLSCSQGHRESVTHILPT